MAHVTVTIAGKTYRMACGDGEEPHLAALAQDFDARVAKMREAFGEIGDMRLHVMAALTLADELAELKTKLAAQNSDLAELRALTKAAASERAADEARLAEGIGAAAERIERLSRRLAGNSAG